MCIDRIVQRIILALLVSTLAACGQATPMNTPPATPPPAATPTAAPPPTATPAASQADQELAAQIDTMMNNLNKADEFAGAVLVAHNGYVIINKGYGLADRENKIPNTPTTRFRVASITKGFTAIAILMLQEEGKLNVDDLVCKYIPDCPKSWQAIKIHHLLTHTAGLYDFRDFAIYGKALPTPSTSAQVIARIKEKPLYFAPGQSFAYTNGGFMVAGYVVEQVSGQSYEKYLQEHIFGPLGMKNTGYAHDDSGLAVGYNNRSTREARLDGSLPFAAAGLYSTVEDLYLYTQALASTHLLSQKSLDALFGLQKQADGAGDFGPDFQLPVYYGYGWAIASYNGHREIGHDGWIEGYGADVRFFPDDKFTMILLKNQSEPRAIDFGDMIVEAIFKAK